MISFNKQCFLVLLFKILFLFNMNDDSIKCHSLVQSLVTDDLLGYQNQLLLDKLWVFSLLLNDSWYSEIQMMSNVSKLFCWMFKKCTIQEQKYIPIYVVFGMILRCMFINIYITRRACDWQIIRCQRWIIINK